MRTEPGENELQPANAADDAPVFRIANEGRLRVTVASSQALMAGLRTRLESGATEPRGAAVATVNLDHLVKLRATDAAAADFRSAYLAHEHIVADGNPIVWLSRIQHRPVALAPGSELVVPICGLAAETGAPVALFGSSDQALAAASTRLREMFPGLAIVYAKSPEMGFEPEGEAAEQALGEIAASGARICFLAFGAPKQERFAARGRARCSRCDLHFGGRRARLHRRRPAPRAGMGPPAGAGMVVAHAHQPAAPWIALSAMHGTVASPRA